MAFAVSVWGLHYKLSLYQSQALRGHAPAAKLLSQKERPVAVAQLEQALVAGRPVASASHSISARVLATWVLVALALPERRLLCDRLEDSLRLQLVLTRRFTPRGPPITV